LNLNTCFISVKYSVVLVGCRFAFIIFCLCIFVWSIWKVHSVSVLKISCRLWIDILYIHIIWMRATVLILFWMSKQYLNYTSVNLWSDTNPTTELQQGANWWLNPSTKSHPCMYCTQTLPTCVNNLPCSKIGYISLLLLYC